MNKGKIILKAKLELISPLQIGSGSADISDRDIIVNADGRPYIPASSFIGKLNAVVDDYSFSKYLGIGQDHQSRLQLDDLEMDKNNFEISVRDGIRINNKTNLVEDGAKFDYQVLEPGVCFNLNMYFDVNCEDDFENLKEWIPRIVTMLKCSFFVGARQSAGSGELVANEITVMKYDFANKRDAIEYLIDQDKADCKELSPGLDAVDNSIFTIIGDFTIPSSLIVRSYPDTPFGSDAVHLKSNNRPVLPGSSVRGALRARGERILNTIWEDKSFTQQFIAAMFGYASVEKEKPYTIPSHLRVNEVFIDEVASELQNRIQIDRFTGGTIKGALFDSMPLFQKSDQAQVKGLRIDIKKALDSQKGLMLLIFKDLYYEDLAIGGEKNVGRGCLKGITANIIDNGNKYENIFDENANSEQWDKYIKALHENADKAEIEERFNSFLPEKS